jgi:Ca-activated chloride channel family protein
MGIVNSNKVISANRIDCDGTLKVTIALTAAPDIVSNPTDIALVLDRSGSMEGSALANMKAGAKKFIDIIEEATDGVQDGVIGSGSHIGIVSFATTATADTQLITSVATLKSAVDALSAGGNTNHADAFTKAMALFDPTSTNHRVIVMFTDGNTTVGAPPAPVAAAARAAGIVIYAIGLIGTDGVDVSALNNWASDPDASHVAVTPDDAELEELFAQLAANITKPGATNIVIDEIVEPDFIITSVLPPNKGTASMVNARTLKWTIASLGTTASEGAALEFYIRHTAQTSGDKKVNQSISYSDTEGNAVTFPDPAVWVDCGMVICPEPCPEPVELAMDGCSDTVQVDMGDVYMQSMGRIAQMDVTIKNVCPGKRVALAVILTEVDQAGQEHARGLKTVTVPAHHAATCRDVLVKCVKFVLPEDLDVSGDTPLAMCNPRNLRARFIAHPIDTDYLYCPCDTDVT